MFQVLRVNPKHPQDKIISHAVKVIRNNGLVAFPTETVYGIAANVSNSKKLNKIKKRPKGKPYTIHIGYKKDLYKFVKKLSPISKAIIKKYWPGPLTLLLKDNSGRKTGFRMPDNKIALKLIRTLRKPVIAPSANLSGRPSSTTIRQVLEFAKATAKNSVCLDLILDGGPAKYKNNSTILDLTVDPPKILRKGCLNLTKFSN